MFRSFSTKLGVLLMTLTLTLVLGLTGYFYQYSQNNLMADLKRAIGDVSRTASFVFGEEERQLLEQFRDSVLANINSDVNANIAAIDNSPLGETKALFSADISEQFQASIEFQSIVQLLRRVQAGSRNGSTGLDVLAQSNFANENPSRVAWAYLLVELPGATASKSLMFLADSNYQVDVISPYGNPVGNLYRAADFFFLPFKGEMGIAEGWYTDEFGTVLSAAVPITNEQGHIIAALGIDYDVATFQDRIDRQVIITMSLLLVAVIFSFGITSIIVFTVSVPLSKLSSGARQQLAKDFRHRVDIVQNDEFGLLANTMNQVSQSMHVYTEQMDTLVAQRTAALEDANRQVTRLNQRLQDENTSLGEEFLDLKSMKDALISTSECYLNSAGYHIYLQYLPSKHCSGDVVVERCSTDALSVTLANVSGFGVDVAAVSMQVFSLLKFAEPETALAACNALLYEQMQRKSEASFAHVVAIESEGECLKLRGYGNPVIVFSRDTALAHEIDGQPFGVEAIWSFVPRDGVKLSQNHMMLSYTEGFLNALRLLHGSPCDMTAEQIISISKLREQTLAELFQQFKQQGWYRELEHDISAVLILPTGEDNDVS